MEALLELETWRWLVVLGPSAAILLVAAISDALEQTIPNWLTYPSIGVGLAAQTAALGWHGLGWGLAAAVVTFLVGLVLFLPGWLGGGDVKLLTGVAAFLGFGALGEVLFYAIWTGFILGIALSIINGYFIEMWQQIGRFFRGIFRAIWYRTGEPDEEMEPDERAAVPFGVAVFIGFVLAYSEAKFGWPGFLDWFLGSFR